MKSYQIDNYPEVNYIISKDLQIISKKNWELINSKTKMPIDSIGILNKKSDDIYKFNFLVGTLIKKFKKSANSRLVLSAFAQEFDLVGAAAHKKLILLFEDLIAKKIIVDASDLIVAPTSKKELDYSKMGRVMAGYQLLKKLNSHELLQVYLAQDHTNKNYILKLYPEDDDITAAQKTVLQASLFREITILSYFQQSRYVNKIVSYDSTKNYAVLEYFKGKSLKEHFITKESKIKLVHRLKIITQIIDALSFIHSNQYMHGDIHDKNIMIDKDYNIQLIDFGLSMHSSEENLTNIRKGGIHFFLPPERIKNNVFKYLVKNPSFQSDIYQLGIIIYIILYSRYPFVEESWKTTTSKILNNKMVFDSKTNSTELLPVDLIEFTKKCINKNLDIRFQSAKEMAEQWNKFYLN